MDQPTDVTPEATGSHIQVEFPSRGSSCILDPKLERGEGAFIVPGIWPLNIMLMCD
jgi:hypothetical protein